MNSTDLNDECLECVSKIIIMILKEYLDDYLIKVRGS